MKRVDGATIRVRRGVRRTAVADHEADAPILTGRTFERDVTIPAHRSHRETGDAR